MSNKSAKPTRGDAGRQCWTASLLAATAATATDHTAALSTAVIRPLHLRQQFGNEAVIPATVGLRFSSKTIGPRLPVSVGGVWRSLIEMRLGPIDEEVSACASQPKQSTPPAPA